MPFYITRDKNRHVVALGEVRDGWRAATPVDAQGRATGATYWLDGKTMVEKHPTPAAAHAELARRAANEDRLLRHLNTSKHTIGGGVTLVRPRR